MKLLTWLVLFVFVTVVFGQSSGKPGSEPRFSELSPDDSKRLDQQRALIAGIVKQKYGAALTRTQSDLPVLQKLLDEHVFKKSQIYELQSLGVVFGDVLASKFPLSWVIVTDEYGTDPTLRFKKTSININALTMISKRVERDERVDVYDLVRKTADALPEAEKHEGQ
jgi:hypothetical protein